MHCEGVCLGQYNDLPGCTAEKLEACGTDFVIYANTTRLPQSGEEFSHICRELLRQLNCSDNFSRRCLSGFARAAAILGLGSALDFYDEACNVSTPLSARYRKHIGCLNKAGEKLNERLRDILVKLYTVKETVKDKEKINYACCLYPEFLEDTEAVINSQCSDPETNEFFVAFMDSIFGELLGLACGPYQGGSELCRKLPRLKLEKWIPGRARNFVEPMVDIVHSISQSR